jgi:hypothetical protein
VGITEGDGRRYLVNADVSWPERRPVIVAFRSNPFRDTKILYFLAKNALQDSSADYPLILDTKVSMVLAQMTGYRLLVRPASYRPRPDSAAYVQFVKAIHAWQSSWTFSPR